MFARRFISIPDTLLQIFIIIAEGQLLEVEPEYLLFRELQGRKGAKPLRQKRKTDLERTFDIK